MKRKIEKLLTVREVSEWLDIHPLHIRKKAVAGIIRASKVGRAWRFKKGDVDKFLKDNDNSKAVESKQ
jgi:excisionase family DNA binding protein